MVKENCRLKATVPNVKSRTTYDHLAHEVYPRVFKFAMKLTRNVDQASDLTQETFFKALRSEHSRTPDRDPSAWFCKIAFNCFMDQIRYQKRRPKTISTELLTKDGYVVEFVSSVPTPEALVFNKELSLELTEALSLLTEAQRRLVILSDLEDCSHAELAEIFGCAISTVRTRLHRAHLLLRKHLSHFHEFSGLQRMVRKT